MYTLRKEAQKEDPDLNRTYSQLLACTRSGKKRRKKILT